MSLKVGIVGLPNVGKSTLFNALLKKQVALAQNYPFTTIEPNVGVVEVPDERLEKLKEVVEKSEGLAPAFKIIPAIVEFVDIAGLVKGASKGEGLGNKFLSHIREVDAIVFVVRDFKSEDIIKTGESPREDLEVLKTELMMKDLETVSSKLETRNKKLETINIEVVEKARTLVEQGKWLAEELTDEELLKISELSLLSAKKIIVVVNSDEEDLLEVSNVSNGSKVSNVQGIDNAIRISAKLEEELAALSTDEQKEYMSELGITESGLAKLAKRAYEVLGLATFLTAGSKEVRAWTIKYGSLAPAAAGVIHGDFERGFIAADIVPFEKFVDAGGWKEAKAKGLVKTIGKAEVMPEGSVVEFKFSV